MSTDYPKDSAGLWRFDGLHKALMVDAIQHAGLTTGRAPIPVDALRSVEDIADDILTILSGMGWRLIHD